MANTDIGIVGLPNVGKSTLFNAVSAARVEAANYPFATIEPNVGVVAVPDERLDVLARLAASQRVVAATVEFRDIAGLVRGASTGEGLGNQFLSHIRETDAIVHVVRCFDDPDVVHVEGSVDPARDIDTIETELLLADLATVDKRGDRAVRAARSGDRAAQRAAQLVAGLQEHLAAGRPARSFGPAGGTEVEERALAHELGLLTENVANVAEDLYVANVAEDEVGALAAGGGRAWTRAPPSGKNVEIVRELAREQGAEAVVICADHRRRHFRRAWRISEVEDDAGDEDLAELARLASGWPGRGGPVEADHVLHRCAAQVPVARGRPPRAARGPRSGRCFIRGMVALTDYAAQRGGRARVGVGLVGQHYVPRGSTAVDGQVGQRVDQAEQLRMLRR